ncbi:DUF397 domain-containing protein [Streptomyces sp. CC77]|uniref:DUF397 domain-containing protein n=1 Tax=Streptomyces sp. CC77 TaxID=1906739 RepID=UPI0008DD3F37|nr:DUF397 domain-containing protein [Streptomyces sp. CC77]OII69072.1 DUF397 domain-containing protein [Streptomyces sp. CC77]
MSTPDLHWSKSSYSGGAGDNCIEVARGTGSVHVRDSKDTHRPALTVSPTAWARFLRHPGAPAS